MRYAIITLVTKENERSSAEIEAELRKTLTESVLSNTWQIEALGILDG
jgi:hypothetical protein